MRIDPIKSVTAAQGTQLTEIHPTTQNDKSFGKILTNALTEVNTLQKDTEKSAIDLVTGRLQDISQVTIAAEKASVALQLTMQVRNKAIDAYQEIMRMQV